MIAPDFPQPIISTVSVAGSPSVRLIWSKQIYVVHGFSNQWGWYDDNRSLLIRVHAGGCYYHKMQIFFQFGNIKLSLATNLVIKNCNSCKLVICSWCSEGFIETYAPIVDTVESWFVAAIQMEATPNFGFLFRILPCTFKSGNDLNIRHPLTLAIFKISW